MRTTIKKIFYGFFIAIILSICFSNKIFATDNEPNINSKAAILIENETGNVLYEKNSAEKMYPASTTKIMTAILTIENCDLSETATVSKNAVDLVPSGYTNAKLVAGEKISVEDLLYALMLNSANEAANVLAEHVAGSIDEFSNMMTEKAIELGCKNTNFKNANGMHDDDHYTTAEDLAIITKYCMQNTTFRKIVSTTKYTLPATNQYPNTDRIMKNTNSLIDPTSNYFYEYAIGVKTGYTKQAGNCLVSFAEKDGIELICVTLNADSTNNSVSYRFQDNKNLLEYGFENFSNLKIMKKNTIVDTIEIENATKESKDLKIVIKDDVYDYIPNDSNIEKTEVKINEGLKAPIYIGDTVGEITYTANGKTYTQTLIADNAIYTAHNYGGYILTMGLIILVISIIIIPKRKTKKTCSKH